MICVKRLPKMGKPTRVSVLLGRVEEACGKNKGLLVRGHGLIENRIKQQADHHDQPVFLVKRGARA
ncbi:hypothetical protein CPZ30_20870 [Paenibacillus lautus]|nr:hypothetical protein CPZ30_20870 [Paenibacillus lautus]